MGKKRRKKKKRPAARSLHPGQASPDRPDGDPTDGFDTALRHYQAGMLSRAEAICRSLLSTTPDHSDALHLLGLIAHRVNRHHEAAALIRKALAVNPQNSVYYNNLGNVCLAANRLEQAAENFAAAIRIAPETAEAHINLGNVWKYSGDANRAEGCYLKALSIDPGSTGAYYNLAQLKSFQKGDDAYAALESLKGGPCLSGRQSAELHFALGKMYADIGAQDAAFTNYQAGNEYRKTFMGNRFDPDAFDRQIALFMETFDADFFARRRISGSDSRLPVFIVGMPRSGTSLIEQILSSHPRVFGAGELPLINQMVTAFLREYPGIAFDRIWEKLDRIRAQSLAGQYLRALETLSVDSVRITDKMPGNFLNLWFIALLFPQAKIIHCRRHPLDTCLSCYFTHFRQPLPYTDDLHTLGRYYRQYERLMTHWRSVLPVSILEIQYEALVENQESMTRRMLGFCDLEWEGRCLAFYDNDRPVTTASGMQVRKKIYTDAVGRWRKYARFLGPLMESLGEAVVQAA